MFLCRRQLVTKETKVKHLLTHSCSLTTPTLVASGGYSPLSSNILCNGKSIFENFTESQHKVSCNGTGRAIQSNTLLKAAPFSSGCWKPVLSHSACLQAVCTQHHLPGKMLQCLPTVTMTMFVLGFHRKFAHAMLVYCHCAPLRTVWGHPARWSWRQQQRCNKCGWCENTLITKKKGDTEHFIEEWVTRLCGLKRKFINGKFKRTIFKICYLSSCNTNPVNILSGNKPEIIMGHSWALPHSNDALGDYF